MLLRLELVMEKYQRDQNSKREILRGDTIEIKRENYILGRQEHFRKK